MECCQENVHKELLVTSAQEVYLLFLTMRNNQHTLPCTSRDWILAMGTRTTLTMFMISHGEQQVEPPRPSIGQARALTRMCTEMMSRNSSRLASKKDEYISFQLWAVLGDMASE